MSDIQLTIGDTTKNFDLATEQGKKAFAVVEEPIVPLKAATDVPGYGDLPAEKILAFVQNNWRGGMGQKNKFEVADMYGEGYNIDTREPNMIFLGPKINVAGTIADTIIALEFFDEREYAASTTKVYRLNTAGTVWDLVLTIEDDTIECLAQYDGYIFVGLTDGMYYYSETGNDASWTQTTLDYAIAHKLCVSPAFSGTKDVLVLATRPNIVRTSLSPLEDGVGWLDPPYYVGDENSDITSLFVLNGTLFIGKEDGVYALGTDGRPVAVMPEYKQKRDATNFKAWTMWQSVFYGSVSGDVMEIVGGSSSLFSIDFMGPLERSPELATVGSVKGLAADDKNIYALMLVGTKYIIYTGRERRDNKYGLRWEWVPYSDLGTNVCGAIRVMQRDGENPKLWFAYGTNMANIVLSRSPNYPLGDTNYRFTTQGYVYTSYFDANYDTWSKIFYQLWLVTDKIVADHQYVKVFYQKDEETSWSLLTVVDASGTQSVNLPSISCKKIRLKIELNSDDTTLTPVVSMFILRGILRPEITRSIDFAVVLGQSDSRKPSSDLAFIRSGRTADTPITLRDLRFGTTRYITFLSNSPMEIEDIDEQSKQPTYKARILAQELNWSPP
jgi:hypothetical protein